MDHHMEYWFCKYDNESFERDFIKVPYMDILSQLMADPDFQQIPNHAYISNDDNLAGFQQCLQKVIFKIVDYFSTLNLDEGLTDPFSKWGRLVLAFLDCEKLYSILFWGLNFIPMFVECRVQASFIRLIKFVMSFIQNIITTEGMNQMSNITGDGGRRLNIVIKRLVETNPQNGIYPNWNLTQQLQKDILVILKPLATPNPSLVSKLYYIVSHMFDLSINQIKKQSDQLYGNIEAQLVQKILAENVHAIQHIDNYIQQQENMLVDDFNEDQDIFERSEALKSLVEQTEKDYLPDNLKTKIYGGERVVEKNEDFEKSKKKQILARIERREKKERERQQNLQQNYMEKLRQNRELITAGTMVTQESGEGDFRPRQLKSTFAQQLKDENNSKKDNQVNQFRFQKYSDSDSYKQSPNNPMNMKGSVVAFLAKDVLEKFYEEQEKKKKRDDEQQSRLKKQKSLQQSQVQPSGVSQQSTAAPINSDVNSKSLVLQSIVSGDHTYIENSLHDGLVDYINKADQNLVAIKDEDIALEEPGKKRRYRLKKKKIGNSQDNTLGGSEQDVEFNKKSANQVSQTSEQNDDEAKRNLAKELLKQQNQVLFQKLKITHIQEKPVEDEIKDIELFQYSFEESLDDDDIEEEEDKKKRLQFIQQKIPIPKNASVPQQGIVFEKFKEYTGDKEKNEVAKLHRIMELYCYNRKTLTLGSKNIAPQHFDDKWQFLQGYTKRNKILKRVGQEIVYDYEDVFLAVKPLVTPQLQKTKQYICDKQIF